MYRMAITIGVMAACFPACPAANSETATTPTTLSIPPNTIDCKDWNRNADGIWSASSTAKPFDLGRHKGIKYAGRKIDHSSAMFDDTDLWEVLEAKCLTQPNRNPESRK